MNSFNFDRFLEPDDEFEYDNTFVNVVEGEYEVVYTYDDGDTTIDEETAKGLHDFYTLELDQLKEEGLVKFEVYEIVEEIGAMYGKHEDDYEEEVIERSRGDLLYSEEF